MTSQHDVHTNDTHTHEETGTLSRSLQKTLHLSRRVSSPGQTRHLCDFLLHPFPPVPPRCCWAACGQSSIFVQSHTAKWEAPTRAIQMSAQAINSEVSTQICHSTPYSSISDPLWVVRATLQTRCVFAWHTLSVCATSTAARIPCVNQVYLLVAVSMWPSCKRHSKLPNPWNTWSRVPPWFWQSLRSPFLCAKYEHRTVSFAFNSSYWPDLFWSHFLLTWSSFRFVIEGLDVHRSSHKDDQLDLSTTLTLRVSRYFFEASDKNITLNTCSRFFPFSVISLLIWRALEFQTEMTLLVQSSTT